MADVVVNTETTNSTELLGQGIRAYVLQDFNSAVTALSKASELMAKELGDDMHKKMGEVYLYYGKSLLGLSREENEALGDAVPKGQEDSGDEEDDAPEEVEDGKENGEAGTSEDGKNGEKTNSSNPSNGEKVEATSTSDSGEGTSNGTAGPPEESTEPNEDEEPTDLQVAWEVLELAKKIFQQQGDAGKKNLADTLIVLGEIALESENFASAISDIKDGLEIQKSLFGKESRVVAESYFKLGVAYSTDSQVDEAITSFNSALEYLRARIAHLEAIEEKKDDVNDEIKEINTLIPDIEEKIADMRTYKDEALKKIIATVTEKKAGECSSSSDAGSSKPASDISHLVKKKRKIDEIGEKEVVETNAAKKPSL